MYLETISSTGGKIVCLLNLANIFVGHKMYQSAKNILLKLFLHKFHIIFAVIYKDYYLSNMNDKDSGANSQNYRETNSSGWGRVGNFRPKNFSSEVGIDGTIGLFRRNSGCSPEQKILGIPFCSMEQKYKQTLGILFQTFPRKRQQLEIPFRSTVCLGWKHAVISVCWSRIFCKTNFFMPFPFELRNRLFRKLRNALEWALSSAE